MPSMQFTSNDTITTLVTPFFNVDFEFFYFYVQKNPSEFVYCVFFFKRRGVYKISKVLGVGFIKFRRF